MLKLKQFVFSPFMENTYILWDEETKETAIVDPGCLAEHEEKELESFVNNESLIVKFLINTHCHIDHVFGNAFVKEKFNPRYYAPEKDVFLLDMMPSHAKDYGIEMKFSPNPQEFLTEDLELKLGGNILSFIFTPGHTPGEFCIYIKSAKICISGDVLFKESIGRTDLWGGDYNTLLTSIKNKLFILPDDVTIYPGHGNSSTIGYEKINNPFLNNE